MKQVWSIIIVAAGLLCGACENSNNIDDPSKKYFTRLIGENGDQWGVDLVVAPDGSMVLLGNTLTPTHGQQLYVVRTTPQGYVMWTRELGEVDPAKNAGLIDDEAKDIELMLDGRIAILGMKSEAGNRDFMIRLMDIDGRVTDSTTYGVAGFTEEANSITEISNGFIVSGYTTNVTPPSTTNPADGMFVRFYKHLAVFPSSSEPLGVSWSTARGSATSFDVAVKTIEVGSSYYVFGYSNRDQAGVADHNPFVWVLGSTGISTNDFTIDDTYIPGSFVGGDDIVSSVSVVPPQSGSGYIVSGYSIDRLANTQKMFSLKIRSDIDGVPSTDIPQILAGERTDDDSNSSITTTSRGAVFSSAGSGFFVLGCRSVGNEDIYLKKLEVNLTDAWTAVPFFSFGGVGNDWPGAVAESPDGRIVLLGTMVLGEGIPTSQRKMVLMKLSPNGKLGE
jgi:hypothetical protein